jgi:hypothetical protein
MQRGPVASSVCGLAFMMTHGPVARLASRLVAVVVYGLVITVTDGPVTKDAV